MNRYFTERCILVRIARSVSTSVIGWNQRSEKVIQLLSRGVLSCLLFACLCVLPGCYFQNAVGQVEIVPTPEPDKKATPEVIPTPDGIAERIAKNTPDKKPVDYDSWPKPDVALFITGQQNGYIEPCGCTGLDKQKGGVARRMTMMKELQQKGWDLLPIDSGNQIRRSVPQASIKLSWSSEALKQMKYEAVGFGPDDMRLRELDLLQVAMADSPESATFVSGNVVLIDPDAMPSFKVVTRGKFKIGITTILDPAAIKNQLSEDVTISAPVEAAQKSLDKMNAAGANYRVLAFFGVDESNEEDAVELIKKVKGYDLVVVSGSHGEPTYQPARIEGTKTDMILTGYKGMYVGLVGLYDGRPMRYARVALTDKFSDAKEMRQLMGEYQEQLKQLGLDGLGLEPIPHSSGQEFVGSKSCKKCHELAYDIWESSDHFLATKHIVEPTQDRGDVARHFDPECLSCHVTGWIPQNYHPYESGFLALESGAHLTGNGCENCHGPGKKHVEVETQGSGASDAEKAKWRKEMDLPIDKARDHCMKCHDLDNSPEFGEPGAFEDIYWPEIEHNE